MKIILLFIVTLLLSFSLVLAADLSVSPAKITVDDMLRDGYAERTVRFRTLSQTSMDIIIDWNNDSMGEWITVLDDEGELYDLGGSNAISIDSPIILKFIMEPKADLANGLYIGSIFARTDFGSAENVDTGSTVQIAVALKFEIGIDDQQIVECRSEIGKILDIEERDTASLSLRVYNDGNVRLSPNVQIDLWSFDRSRKYSSFIYNNHEILPSLNEEIIVPIPSEDLLPGQYFVDVGVIQCDENKELSFDILEEGERSSSGDIIKVISPIRSIVKDPVSFVVEFKNTGEKKYLAYFKGGLWLDDQLQAIVESDELSVSPSQTLNFDIFTETKNTGLHYLKGHVYYDKKRTFEQSVTLKVFPESQRAEVEEANSNNRGPSVNTEKSSDDNSNNYYWYLIILIIIGFLILIIRKKKRRRRRF